MTILPSPIFMPSPVPTTPPHGMFAESASFSRRHLALWSDGVARASILDFVARTTKPSGPDYIPPEQRVAAFGYDGVLWGGCAYKVEGAVFAARLRRKVEADPTLRSRPSYRAFFEEGVGAAALFHDMRVPEFLREEVCADMEKDEFVASVREWTAAARHPDIGLPFSMCGYRPQIELVSYLHDHGFRTVVFCEDAPDVVRVLVGDLYRIPSCDVISRCAGGRSRPHSDPVLAFGLSPSDAVVVNCSAGSGTDRLILVLSHDDVDRGDEAWFGSAASDIRSDGRIQTVSIRRDWKTVFGD